VTGSSPPAPATSTFCPPPNSPGSYSSALSSLCLLLALCPSASFRDNVVPDVPLLSFQDDLLGLAPVEVVAGSVVVEMIVEDVAVDCAPDPSELRRRLRFKRMPCLVQTQVRLACQSPPAAASSLLGALEEGSGGLLLPQAGGSLVQPYLQAMVAGLAVIAPSIEESIQSGARPRCLCAGVGGGSLPMSIRVGLQFNVLA
jgi:hypothetical protein